MLEEMFGCANRRVKQVTPAQPKRQPSAKELEHEEINVLIFTDIQDSTKLWQSIPDTMPTVLATHDECVRALIEAHGGYEVKTEGDAFMISFTSAGDAVEFAASLQPALLKCEWPEEALDQPACCEQTSEVGSLLWKGPRVRVGMHIGTTMRKEVLVTGLHGGRAWKADFFGQTVNLAARVSALAAGGQTLVTQAFKEVVDREVPGAGAGMRHTWSLVERGEQMLKGIPHPVNVFELIPISLTGRTFPPFKSIAAVKQQQAILSAMLTTKVPDYAKSDGFASVGKQKPGAANSSKGRLTTDGSSLSATQEEGSEGGGVSSREELSAKIGAGAPSSSSREGEVDDFASVLFTMILTSYAAEGDAPRLQALLTANPSWDRSLSDYDWRTPLHLAACSGSNICVGILLAHGVRIDPKDRWGNTPLDDARRHGLTGMAEYLISRGHPETKEVDSAQNLIDVALVPTRLCHAAGSGDIDELERLLEAHPEQVSVGDYDKRTALHVAVCQGQSRVVKRLLEAGASVAVKDIWNNTPLDDAKRLGIKELEAMLEAK